MDTIALLFAALGWLAYAHLWRRHAALKIEHARWTDRDAKGRFVKRGREADAR